MPFCRVTDETAHPHGHHCGMAAKSTKKTKPLTDAQIEQRRAAGRQKKTMTPAAIEQRRAAAALSTGPVTEDGKIASSRNGWKTGEYSQIARGELWQELGLGAMARPCKTTCDKYPCSLVNEGVTQPGADCMDKQVFVEAFDVLMHTLQTGNVQFVHGLLASQVAGALEVLQQVRNSILHNGVLIFKPYITKDGKAAVDPRDKDQLLGSLEPNPLLGSFGTLLDKMGISLPELMATPRSVSKLQPDGDDKDPMTRIFETLGEAFGRGVQKKPGNTFNEKGDRI